MWVFELTLATPANNTTSGTPGTATEMMFLKPGATNRAGLQALYVQGKATALASINGLAFRVKRWTTASTAGTAITPVVSRGGDQPAAGHTAANRPTAGSGGGTIEKTFGCPAGGPGGWWALNPAAIVSLPAASAASISVDDVSQTASMTYEWSGESIEGI